MALTDEETLYNIALGYLGEWQVEDTTTSRASDQYTICERYYDRTRDEVLSDHYWNEATTQKQVLQETDTPLFDYDYKFALPSDCLKVKYIGQKIYDWEIQGGYLLTSFADGPDVWSSGKRYTAGMYVVKSSTVYLCATTHISGTFATDLSAGLWTSQTSDWATTTAYTAGDYVINSSTTYRCIVSHTSGTFATDLASGYWQKDTHDLTTINLTYIKQLTTISSFSDLLYDAIAVKLASKIAPRITNSPDVKNNLINLYESIVLRRAKYNDAIQEKPKSKFNSSWLRARTGY